MQKKILEEEEGSNDADSDRAKPPKLNSKSMEVGIVMPELLDAQGSDDLQPANTFSDGSVNFEIPDLDPMLPEDPQEQVPPQDLCGTRRPRDNNDEIDEPVTKKPKLANTPVEPARSAPLVHLDSSAQATSIDAESMAPDLKAQTILFKPFLLRAPCGIYATELGFDQTFKLSFNRDLVLWNQTTWAYTTNTHSGDKVSVHKTYKKDVNILHILQGKFGVPELVAYYVEASSNERPIAYYATKMYNSNPATLSIENKIRQLLLALDTIHKECVQNGRIDFNSVQWKGDEIKLTQWRECSTRSDMFSSNEPTPARDLNGAGKVIKEWCKTASERDKVKFNRLAEALMVPCAFRKMSLSAALQSIDDPSILDQFFAEYGSIADITFEQRLKCCSETELLSFIRSQITEVFESVPEMTHEEALKHVGIDQYTVKEDYAHIYLSNLGEDYIVAKILKTEYLSVESARELYISQLLSNSSERFPELIKYHMYKNSTHPTDKFNILMVFTRYLQRPPTGAKDIFKFSADLLSAIELMHDHHLIHSDVAPNNIVWDITGRALLIDFGSAYFANIVQSQIYVMNVSFGHPGFEPADDYRVFATDVYSAGKTIQFFAQQWEQWSDKIEAVVKLMTDACWTTRITIKEAAKLLQECK